MEGGGSGARDIGLISIISFILLILLTIIIFHLSINLVYFKTLKEKDRHRERENEREEDEKKE